MFNDEAFRADEPQLSAGFANAIAIKKWRRAKNNLGFLPSFHVVLRNAERA